MEHKRSDDESTFNPNEERKVVDYIYTYLIRPNTDCAERIDREMKNQKRTYRDDTCQGVCFEYKIMYLVSCSLVHKTCENLYD